MHPHPVPDPSAAATLAPAPPPQVPTLPDAALHEILQGRVVHMPVYAVSTGGAMFVFDSNQASLRIPAPPGFQYATALSAPTGPIPASFIPTPAGALRFGTVGTGANDTNGLPVASASTAPRGFNFEGNATNQNR